ncbi:hypothetical protein LTR78_007377 [Recurvomyces mirabilis]|uniref:Caleosin-domain-containing protein n=1 Tax=Recurvomyces mirabilis TaxID=574656 RepID=A0AAE0WJD2_9PEZI|nr:hypothetical protein LTR78_007377 [Recurvomyces mirabilis]KAK5155035.1 hypothetical protein LTS14_005990 [Recurvomyces mirabilis]
MMEDHGIIATALVAMPDRHNGDLNAAPKIKRLVQQHGKLIDEYPPEKPYNVCVDTVPLTIERLPYIPAKDSKLIDPGTARATLAPSAECPYGTQDNDWAERHAHMTVVQQHCSYWDKDADGIIWPSDTWRGVRAWGWNWFLSAIAVFIINFNLSYPTIPGSILPDPFFRIYLKQVHKCKHGSDSQSYDAEGRFVPQNFENLFAKYDSGNKGGLDVYDVARALKGYRFAFDFFGWSAAMFEWLAVYFLLWPEDGIMRKEDVRRVFDGSIFQQKADEYAEKCARNGRVRKAIKYGRTGY